MKRILSLLILLFISLPVLSEEPKIPNLIWDAKAQKYIYNYDEIEFKYDSNDKLIQIGDKVVKYDANDKIEYIGDMLVKYDKKGRIKDIGSYHLNYLPDGRIASITGKKWLYMRVDYIGFGSNERIRSIGDYYVQYNRWGKIIYLVKF